MTGSADRGDVAVIVPTLRRLESLKRALASLFAQTEVTDRFREIVVVDNDPAGSAHDLVLDLAQGAPTPLIYRHAPVPGVATARNAGLQATEAPLIAFLDDDETATPQWLKALLTAQSATGADVVFGPIRGRVPDGTGWTTPYLERFFGRAGPEQSGLIDRAYGCGNSLMVRETALPGHAPFDVRMDELGGEDDVLFEGLVARGGRFAWAADAWVDEFAPPHRATLNYALTRAFTYGQGPSQSAAARRDILGVARWMVIGAGQTMVWGAISAALMIARRPGRADALDHMARGLGKIFWMKGLEPKFYGAREVARMDARKS